MKKVRWEKALGGDVVTQGSCVKWKSTGQRLETRGKQIPRFRIKVSGQTRRLRSNGLRGRGKARVGSCHRL